MSKSFMLLWDRNTTLLHFLRNYPAWFGLTLKVAFTAAFTIISYTLALTLRFEGVWADMFTAQRFEYPLLILICYRLFAYLYWSINHSYWRYISTHDATQIVKAHFASTLLFTATFGLLRFPDYPRSVIFVEFALSLLLVGGARFLARTYSEKIRNWQSRKQYSVRSVIVLGAGDSGHLLVKSLRDQGMAYDPVAVLDDSKRLIGTSVHGVRVAGAINELSSIIDQHPQVSAVILAIPSLSASRVREIAGLCRTNNLLFKRLQNFEDLAILDVAENSYDTSIESMLQTETEVEHEDEIRNEIRDKVVLVTGAGGSIGSELVRQLLPFEPKSLIMLDSSEYNMFRIDGEIGEKFPKAKRIAALASVCDRDRLEMIFAKHKPEVVFHAAAYKHVPLIEYNCYEALKTNVMGTKNILDATIKHGAKRFVLVSTDKAVDPSSVMGASKRFAELMVQQSAVSQSSTKTAIVRFGNVINSAGSVVPTFKRQILSGGPVTVTHPDMERYFMSIREAVRLILTAGILGESSEIYMLDMGTPIKIVDVAKKMLALYGRRDIPIQFTGIRPGEKLSEILYSHNETLSNTRFRKVKTVESPYWETHLPSEAVSFYEENLSNMTDEQIGVTLIQFANREHGLKIQLSAEKSSSA